MSLLAHAKFSQLAEIMPDEGVRERWPNNLAELPTCFLGTRLPC